MPQDWLERAVPPPPFVDRGEDLTFSRDGDSYRILWDEDGLRPVDMDDWPERIGREHQLFIDEYLASSSCNLRRTVHQPRKHPENPLIVPDRPWEGTRGTIIVAVHRDPETGEFRLWYRTHGGDFPADDRGPQRAALQGDRRGPGTGVCSPDLSRRPPRDPARPGDRAGNPAPGSRLPRRADWRRRIQLVQLRFPTGLLRLAYQAVRRRQAGPRHAGKRGSGALVKAAGDPLRRQRRRARHQFYDMNATSTRASGSPL